MQTSSLCKPQAYLSCRFVIKWPGGEEIAFTSSLKASWVTVLATPLDPPGRAECRAARARTSRVHSIAASSLFSCARHFAATSSTRALHANVLETAEGKALRRPLKVYSMDWNIITAEAVLIHLNPNVGICYPVVPLFTLALASFELSRKV